MIQSALSLWLIREKTGALDLRKLASTTLRAGIATLMMSVLIYLELQLLPVFDQFLYRMLRVLVPFVSAVLVYLYLARVLGLTEIMTLMKSGKQTPEKTE